jgi:hypothetical protein
MPRTSQKISQQLRSRLIPWYFSPKWARAKRAEMEDTYALHISIIAADILKREIGILMVLPKVRAS